MEAQNQVLECYGNKNIKNDVKALSHCMRGKETGSSKRRLQKERGGLKSTRSSLYRTYSFTVTVATMIPAWI